MELKKEIKINITEDINNIIEITANELIQKILDWNKNIENEILFEKYDIFNLNNKTKNNNNLKPLDFKFLISKFPTPIQGIELIDIKLKNNLNEDDVYLEKEFFKKYLRRGESLLFNKNNREYDFARIGMPKFFDYKKYIRSIKDVKMNEFSYGEIKNISNDKNNLKYYVYITTKINGENFQVSYNKKLKAWIIGSKNVSILCRDTYDLQFYENENNFKIIDMRRKNKNNMNVGIDIKKKYNENKINDSFLPLKEEELENNNINNISEKGINLINNESIIFRYKYAVEFGKLWFQIIDKKIGKNRIQNFIDDIEDYTLIGENVGEKSHQHIKIYKEKDIIFYTIINHKKLISEKCLPLNESLKLFKKYGLSYSNSIKSDIFNNCEQLINYINEQYDLVFDKKMDESGEGAVLYFATSEIIDNVEKEIIRGFGKLKTFEYRFLRKIREKCKKIPRINMQALSNGEDEEEFKMIKATIDKTLKFTIKETKDLLYDVPNSIHAENSNLIDWILFAKKVFLYWYLDGYNYVDIFATFIDKMKKIFYKSDNLQISLELIKEVRNEVIPK